MNKVETEAHGAASTGVGGKMLGLYIYGCFLSSMKESKLQIQYLYHSHLGEKSELGLSHRIIES